jgi:valyl-tRNA synthetase
MLKEKSWDKKFEEESLKELKKKKYDFKGKKVYSIDTPPPYVNTPIHTGHATTYTLMDMFARYRRAAGYDVLFPLGLDRNGLPIEMEAEKKFKVRLSDLSREDAIELCRKILEESSEKSKDSFFKLGISFNSYEQGENIGDMYYTDSESYRRMTQSTFIDLWGKGLIYEDKRVNNYCPGCRTTIADAEVLYEERESIFNEIVFRVKETGEEILIGTTRPELLCTCAKICFNPEDEEKKRFEHMHAIVPIYNTEVEIIAHPIAKKEKGTGFVMMCSFGDLNDVRFFRELGIEPEIAITVDGRMNDSAGFLKGLRVREGRERIMDELKKEGVLSSTKKVMHPVPICERSKDEIEFIDMDELYLKQLDFKEDMKRIANEMKFYDESSRSILLDWINSLSMDWPISRRRYYGTEIPLWYCKKCGKPIVPQKGRYYQPWKEDPPLDRCPECGSHEFKGEERIFDTWFDSSSSALYILGYERDDEFFENNFPCTLRPQGKEIIRTWLYYTALKTFLLTGKKVFEDVWINYHIVDESGKKMSKSKGNVIDPSRILERFGAEPFRLWCALEGNLTKDDFRCSFERIEGARKTLTKLWNVARFVSSFEQHDGKITCASDLAIVEELNRLIELCEKGYGEYDFHNPAVELRTFIWNTFSSNYIELVKSRAYNDRNAFTEEEQKSALSALYLALKILLRLFNPIIPFITEKIYRELWDDNELYTFPQKLEVSAPVKMDEIAEVNHVIWKEKKDNGLSLKDGIKKVLVPERFRCIEKDLKETHNIEGIEYSDELRVEL